MPLVALLAACADGTSEIRGAEEPRVKETDRIKTVSQELGKLGVGITELPDGMIIKGRKKWQVKDDSLDSHGDHRLGMMAAIAALKSTNRFVWLMKTGHTRAIREGHPGFRILASDPDPKTQEYALSQQLADQMLPGLAGAEGADYIILAGPVDAIKADIRQLSQMELKKGVLITDVGSVKQAIVDQAQALSQKVVDFIAGHPMAGSHKTGASAGRALLFENSFYFLIPASEQAANHLPHIIAAGLVNQTEETFAGQPLGTRLVAGGFNSITRPGALIPSPELLHQIRARSF